MKKKSRNRIKWTFRSFNVMMSLILLMGMTTFFGPLEAGAEAAANTELYVSLTGSDNTGDGTIDNPFASLEGARDAIRELKLADGLPTGGITVYLRGGNYARTSSFELSSEDSGTADAPITYRAYPGESVSILGGAKIDANDFMPVAVVDSVYDRLSSDVVGHIYQYDLQTKGFNDYGEIVQTGMGLPPAPESPELFFNERVLTLARYPNLNAGDGFLRIGTVIDPGADPRNSGEDYTVRPLPPIYDHGATFQYPDNRPGEWADTSDIWMFGYWFWDWADGTLQIQNIDTTNKQISTTKASVYSVKAGQRYYYFNILEELDAPGEYYLDRTDGKLYIYPPSTLDGSEIEISLMSAPLVSMNEVSFTTFQGMTFGLTRGTAIEMNGGSNNLITGSTFTKIGDKAVSILDGHRNGVALSEIYGTGKGGVLLDGGDRTTLTSGENYVVNSTFHDFSRIQRTYAPAVNIFGVGNRTANNLIYDAPHEAIQFAGNNHIIEYNEIYNVANETSDAGAIYGGRDWTAQGTIIRYNYIHDLGGVDGIGQIAIYLDDLLSGITVYGNILSDVDRGMLIGGGRNNIIENNMILNGNRSLELDDRGLGWAAYHCQPGGALQESLKVVPYLGEPWRTYFPDLANVLTDSPCAPKYNSVQNNLIYQTPGMSVAGNASASGHIQNNWLTNEDPGFVDISNKNWNLESGAALFTQIPDFEPLPFDKMGLNTGVQHDDMLAHISLYSPTKKIKLGDRAALWFMGDSVTGRYIDLFGHTTFSSDKPEVAEVGQDGIVRALAEGEAQITVTALVNGVTLSDSIPITTYEFTPPFIDGFDGFEDGLLRWDVMAGTPTISTEQAHSGLRSFKLDQDKVYLSHKFAENQNKIVTIWYYDTMVDNPQLMAMVDQAEGGVMALGLASQSNTEYIKRIGATVSATGVKRSLGWHEFRWDYTSGTHVSLYIDGVHVGEDTGLTSFKSIVIGDVWDDGRAITNSYFDDVHIFEHATISPTDASFDRYDQAAAFADVLVTLALKGNKLTSIMNGSNTLVADTDYTVADSIVAIHKAYLAGLTGDSATLTFTFSGGADQVLTLALTDTTPEPGDAVISPTDASFDRYDQAAAFADVPVTLTLNGNTLTSIMSDGNTLVADTDYTVADNVVTIHKAYLAGLTGDTAALTFTFSGGADQVLTLALTDTTPETPEVPTSPPSSPSSSPDPADIQGSTGGSFTQTGVQLQFPPNAFKGMFRVVVTKVADTEDLQLPEYYSLIGNVFSITKNLAGSFDKSVTITFDIAPDRTDTDKYDYGIYWFDETAQEWIILDNIKLDLIAGTLSGDVNHFTKFAILAVEKQLPPVEEPEEPASTLLIDIAESWAKAQIQQAVDLGIVSGYPDHTFQPDKSITRAEFVQILVKAFKLEQSGDKVFTDTEGHWAQAAISTAVANGIASGFDANRFRPNDPITREQIAAMVMHAAKLQASTHAETFTDYGQISEWAIAGVSALAEHQIIHGYPDGSFKPLKPATRAEAVVIILNSLK